MMVISHFKDSDKHCDNNNQDEDASTNSKSNNNINTSSQTFWKIVWVWQWWWSEQQNIILIIPHLENSDKCCECNNQDDDRGPNSKVYN